jgi:hypothetical protein
VEPSAARWACVMSSANSGSGVAAWFVFAGGVVLSMHSMPAGGRASGA